MDEFINDLTENYTWYLAKCNEFKISLKPNWFKNFIRKNNNISLNYNLINMQNKYKNFYNELHYKNMLTIKQLVENNDFNKAEVKIKAEIQELTVKNNIIKIH